MNRAIISNVCQSEEIGENGEITTVMLTTEESHQTHVEGN